MAALISIIIILASILLVIVVFVQNPKGGGLSSDFGAAQQLGGVQRTNDFIEKATWSLAATVMVLSIVLTILNTPATQLPGQQREKKEQTVPGQGGKPATGQGNGQGGTPQPR